MTESPALRAVIRKAGLYEHDYASAEGLLAQLVGLGALIEERNEAGELTGYRKAATFPEPPDHDLGPGSPEFQAAVDGIAARETAMLRADARNRAAALAQLEAPIIAIERERFIGQLKAFLAEPDTALLDQLAAVLGDRLAAPASV